MVIKKIETQWKAHKITEPIDVILQLEKSKNEIDLNRNKKGLISIFFNKPFALIIGLYLLIYLFAYLFSLYNPAFNFYWGSYIEVYDKKENRRKLIIGLFVGTILLGVVVNLISNYIWEKI